MSADEGVDQLAVEVEQTVIVAGDLLFDGQFLAVTRRDRGGAAKLPAGANSGGDATPATGATRGFDDAIDAAGFEEVERRSKALQGERGVPWHGERLLAKDVVGDQ